MADEVVPVVLCGGAGRRLWPLSRPGRPKQLLSLVGEDTLLADTLERFSGPPYGRPVAVTGAATVDAVEKHLQTFGGGRVIVEPLGRDTAAAVGAAAAVLATDDPTTLLLISPADHAVRRPGALRDAVRTGLAAARGGAIVTFGLPASRPETGFGWIEVGAERADAPGCPRVRRFVEKPDAHGASALLDAGALWNGGLFLAEARVLLEALERHAPQVRTAVGEAVASGVWEGASLHLDSHAFQRAPRISFDHAVLEHTDRAAVVPTDPGWSDLGDFGALWSALAEDGEGDVVVGPVASRDTARCYLRAEGVSLAVCGVEDLVVVATAEGVLVLPRDRAQEVRALVDDLSSTSSER